MSQSLHVGTLVTWSLWFSVVLATGTAWICWLAGAEHDVITLLVGTAGPLSAAAAVAHIRCYALRAVAELKDGDLDAEIRPLR